MPAVTTKKHPYNEDLRVVYVGGQVWENVPKKQATAYVRELRSQLARDRWYCDRRGY